jgi:hypothetical protein
MARRRERSTVRRLVSLLNRPFVQLVGNHKQPATDSMIECGVTPSKSAAWDWPATRDPRDHAPKRLSEAEVRDVVYVGTMSNARCRGPSMRSLVEHWHPGLRLILVGEGADLEVLLLAYGTASGLECRVHRLSRNDEAFAGCACTVVCVLSRHEFTEGMPLTSPSFCESNPDGDLDHLCSGGLRRGRGRQELQGWRCSRPSPPRLRP